MKHLILTGLILIPTLCLAVDNDFHHNQDGDIVGDTASPINVKNYTDKNGNYAGNETRYSNGKTVFRDKDGQVIGIINKDSD
jgi:hypothetical protein